MLVKRRSLRRARIALPLAGLACAASLLGGGSAASADTPDLPWTDLLPATPTANNPQPKPIPHCRKARVKCVDTEIKRLRKLRNSYGCDHRGVFATTYLELTKQLRRDIRDGKVKGHYLSPKYLYREDAYFANVYFKTMHAWDKHQPVAQAWQIALQADENGDYFGAQDMLLGINAHVQNDMPFVLAAQGLRTPKGVSRKPDHDEFNKTLNRAFGPVVAAVRKRFDPSLDLTNSPLTPLDDIAGLQLVRGWREGVWRNAERLLNAKNQAQWNEVAGSIETLAGVQATAIATLHPVGYAPTRDAYCQSQLKG